MPTLYAAISSNLEASLLKPVFNKQSGDMLDTSTEEPLSDTDTGAYIEDTTPKAYEEDNINNYYVGDIVIEKYYNICRNLKVSVYKNLPPNIRYNPNTNTFYYNCFYFKGDNFYYVKDEPHIVSRRPILSAFKEKYKNMLVC